MPDKAIDVVDEAGANLRLQPVDKRAQSVTVTQIENVVARIARIPPKNVSMSDRDVLKNLERNLKLTIFGQDKAIEALSAAIKMSRSGLGDQRRPVGSFLFSGPTGVGKTEVTRQLALAMGVEFVRFDMSEYMERHTVSRLIGAPPGYVGFDQGGLLTEAIAKHPHCVLLLDEIEKAHPDVFNVLLQILDEGRLTDGKGRTVDFRNTVIIMTSNIGSTAIFELAAKDPKKAREQAMAALRELFRPEFLNRIDDIVMFQPLGKDQIEHIIELQMRNVVMLLSERKITLKLKPPAKTLLFREGFDPAYGARPMKRAIQRLIQDPLALKLLDGEVKPGDTVIVDADPRGDEMKFATETAKAGAA
jgi:ATP-dependent Clp protease ATP-binding subunit ClpA